MIKGVSIILNMLFFLYFTQEGFSQKLSFSLNRPDVKKIDSIESANEGKQLNYNGITFTVSKNYFPNSDSFSLAQPISYRRETKPLKTSIEYYYSTPDNIVRLVEFTWNSSNENIKYLNEIFENNAIQFSQMIGNKGKTETEDHGDWSQKTTIWQNEKAYVKQFMVNGSGTYRVRVLLSWK